MYKEQQTFSVVGKQSCSADYENSFMHEINKDSRINYNNNCINKIKKDKFTKEMNGCAGGEELVW